jgi:PmbA protein
MDRNQALELCQIVLEASRADQTEVLLSGSEQSLTRFANNIIHQNVAEAETSASVRAVVGKQQGVASGTDTSPEGLRKLADSAYQMARLSAADEEFRSLPDPIAYDGPTEFIDEATANFGPEQRAEGVKQAIDIAEESGYSAAGAFSVGVSSYAIANSLGVASFQARTGAELSVLVAGDNSSGYARGVSPRVSEINAASLGRIAAEKCRASADPVDFEPCECPVVLEPEAAGDMISMLGIYCFGSLALQEGRTFMAGQMDQKVCGENINIYDDGHDPRGLPFAYDFEGLPKQRVDLIKAGVAAGVVWDSYTANKAGRQSTGHALPAPSSWGPMPLNMFINTGDSNIGEMVSSIERGILVTRFHYTNMVHPIKTVFTGMTRDGTFLIENGQITHGVKNLRFTQSILEALSCVSMISRDGKLTDYVWSPALKVDCFTFSSGTEF